MGKNIRSLQLLRNTILFTSKEAAIAGIQRGATNDGTVKLARYKEKVKSGETEVEVIKTVFGICYNPSEDTTSGATGFSYTIYDSPQEVIAALEKRIKANEDAIKLLNSGDTVSGSVANSIKTAIEKLDADVTSTTGETFVKVQVVETDGKITAVNVTEKDIASAALLGNIGDTADKDTAFGKIAEEAANRATAITAAIDALDVTDTAVTGSYVSAVNETDGKIAVTRAELPTVAEITSAGQAIVAVKEDKGVISATAGNIAAAHVTIADASDHFTATTVEAALEELYSQAGAGSKVTVEEAAGTEEGSVLKVYTIKQGGTAVGTINIPKDLVVRSGSVVKGNWVDGVFTESEAGTGTALKLIIANQTAPVYINTLDLVKDHTAGDGINISDTNKVSVVVDPSSEFLSVGESGVKVSGVKTYVGDEIAKLSGETTSTGGTFVEVQVVEAAGKITAITVSEDDIASAALLGTTASNSGETSAFGYIAKEVVERKAAIQAQKDALDAEIAARKAVDGQSGNAYVANSAATYISSATSLNNADVKLDAAIAANKTAIEESLASEVAARKAEDTKIVAGVGLTMVGEDYKIAANSGDNKHITSDSTVKEAIYTLDNALAAAKKKNELTSSAQTIAISATTEGTNVDVNVIADTAENGDNNPFVTFDKTSKKLIYCEAILDAGTY